MKKTLLLSLFALISAGLFGQLPTLTHTQFATGFDRPLDIAHCGDERLFIVEQDGRIKITDLSGNVNGTDFLDIDSRVINSGNERGLLGLAFHPEYKQNGYFYVYYSNNSGNTVLSRFSVSAADSNIADPNTEQILMTFNQPFSNHNGGCIKFGPDGYLYVGLGDGGSGGDPSNYAQNPNSHLGKMLRIDVDNGNPYGIPADNPFINDAGTLDEIWAVGVRNPWRWSFDRVTGDIWIGDVGQNSWEEIDFEPAGSGGGINYGWRCYEGTSTYNTSGCGPVSNYAPPVYTYTNNFSFGCSVTGGFRYRGGLFGDLYGIYVFADYCSGRFFLIYSDGMGGWLNSDLGTNGRSVSSFGEDLWGELYYSDLSSGRIYKISTSGTDPSAAVNGGDAFCQGDSLTLSTPFNPALTYQWYLNGTAISGATSAEITVATAGNYHVVVTNGGNAANSDTVAVTMDAPVAASLGSLGSTYCTDDGPVTLTGAPSGGTFSGPGVSDSIFDPAVAGAGTHVISYSYANGACIDTDTQSVVVTVCVSSDLPDYGTLSIAPNPSDGHFNLSFHLETGIEAEVSVLDLSGKLIFNSGKTQFNSGKNIYPVQLRGISAGTYLIVLKGKHLNMTEKITIK